MRYTVKEAVGVSIPTSEGSIRVDFAKGTREPKNDGEQAALEHLVAIGVADRVADTEPKKEKD